MAQPQVVWRSQTVTRVTPLRRWPATLVIAIPLILGGCDDDSSGFPAAPIAHDLDNDRIAAFPWGNDFDDDDDGAMQFIAGGTDHDDGDDTVVSNGGAGTFGAVSFYPTGVGPTGLYLADLDDDGHLDLVTSNQNDNTATVYFGDGAGAFIAPVTLTVAGQGGSEAAVGDFDEDGLLDLVVGSTNTLFLNTGSRTFGPAIPLGTAGYRNVVRDVNDDGHLDIVGAEYGNGVVVRLGDGDGTFAAPLYSGSGLASQAITVADFDGDDVLDAAVVTHQGSLNPSLLALLIGNGDGTFQDATTTVLPGLAWQMSSADFEGDGDADVVATDSIFGDVYIVLGDGVGGFAVGTTYDLVDAERMAIADYNGDGNPDLAITAQTSGVSIALGNGDGTFDPFALSGFASAFDVDTGDLNHDGVLDLVVVEISADRAAVQLGT